MGGKEAIRMAERVGFEPTVAKGDTRSPGAPDRPLQHLSWVWRRGWDSNPRGSSPTAFRERLHQPLGHLSGANIIQWLRLKAKVYFRGHKLFTIENRL